jgi:nitrite reductase (NADH) small subunit/3-phenylpropionate/trans-cinnamate dioxygenase ferredoxin subunit
MPDFQTVCKLEDLKPGQGKTVALGSRLIALFTIDGRVCAIDDVCPHMGASLGAGELDGAIVTCLWHGWRFRVTDGTWADNPRIKIPCYAVRVVDGLVQVQPPEPRPAPPGVAP